MFKYIVLSLVLILGSQNTFSSELAILNGKVIVVDSIIKPSVSITGAERPYNPGDLASFGINLKDHAPDNIKDKKIKWESTKPFRVFNDEIILGVGVNYVINNNNWVIAKDEFDIKVSVDLIYEVDDKTFTKTIDAQTKVTVNGIGPTPNPDPDPPLPDLNETSKLSLKWFNELNLDKNVAKVMAENFREVARSINSTSTPQTITTSTAILNQQKLEPLGITQNHISKFLYNLQDYLWVQYNNKLLITVPQYADYWNDIAIGLENVK